MLTKADEAATLVRSKSPLTPKVAVILGSGLGAFARLAERAVNIPYATIPHFRTVSVPGHRGELVVGAVSGAPVYVFAGRAHLYEGYAPEEVAFPVRLAARLGVKVLIVTNSAGGANVNYKPGELMLITDHINLTGANPLTGLHDPTLGDRFVDMSEAYDLELLEVAERAARKHGITVRRGVYLALAGPSYETPAEIRMARTLGADAVGMSTALEVIAARQMKMRVLGVSCISNMAAGVTKQKLDHADVLRAGELASAAMNDLLSAVIAEVGAK
jgi:purine-nucleoside phosphorylase